MLKTKSAIEDPVFTNADDSIVYSLDGKIAYLYGNGVVTYQNLELKANYIEFDMDTKQVYASGLPDSTGNIKESLSLRREASRLRWKRFTTTLIHEEPKSLVL